MLANNFGKLNNLFYFSLNVSNNPKVTNEGLKHICSGLRSIPFVSKLSLNFSDCEKIDHKGVKALANYVKHMLKLEEINFKFKNCGSIN